MTIVDEWGNEFDSKEEADAYWTNQFWETVDAERLEDYLGLEKKFAEWIMSDSTRWEDFKKVFKQDLDEAISSYCSDRYWNSDVEDED